MDGAAPGYSNFNKRFAQLAFGLKEAFTHSNATDELAVDALLMSGKWYGKLGSHGLVKVGTVFTAERIRQLKETTFEPQVRGGH